MWVFRGYKHCWTQNVFQDIPTTYSRWGVSFRSIFSRSHSSQFLLRRSYALSRHGDSLVLTSDTPTCVCNRWKDVQPSKRCDPWRSEDASSPDCGVNCTNVMFWLAVMFFSLPTVCLGLLMGGLPQLHLPAINLLVKYLGAAPLEGRCRTIVCGCHFACRQSNKLRTCKLSSCQLQGYLWFVSVFQCHLYFCLLETRCSRSTSVCV